MESVITGAAKLEVTQEQYNRAVTSLLKDFQRQLQTLREKSTSEGIVGVNLASVQCDKTTKDINNQLKSYHASISKYSKLIDKAIEPYVDITPPIDDTSSDACITFAMEYLSRHGYSNTIQALRAAGYGVSAAEEAYLVQMTPIIQALHQHDYITAQRWSEQHAATLGGDYDKLQFHFDKLRYLQLLLSGDQLSAVEFARNVLYTHYAKFPSELGELMLLLLESPSSTITDVFLQEAIDATTAEFICAAAKVVGLPQNCHLTSLIQAGIDVLPKIKKMLKLKAQTHATSTATQLEQWADLGTLTLDFSNDAKHIHHSLFSCPVTRDVATPDNLPVLLLCGHVVCKSSQKNLPKRGNRFKCPTCYCDMTADDVMEIYL